MDGKKREFHVRFVRVACSNMLQYAPIIAPTHSNALIRVNYDRNMLEHATRTKLIYQWRFYIVVLHMSNKCSNIKHLFFPCMIQMFVWTFLHYRNIIRFTQVIYFPSNSIEMFGERKRLFSSGCYNRYVALVENEERRRKMMPSLLARTRLR